MAGVSTAGQALEHRVIGRTVKDAVHRPHWVGCRSPKGTFCADVDVPVTIHPNTAGAPACVAISVLPNTVVSPTCGSQARLPGDVSKDHSHTVARLTLCQAHNAYVAFHVAMRAFQVAIGARAHGHCGQ